MYVVGMMMAAAFRARALVQTHRAVFGNPNHHLNLLHVSWCTTAPPHHDAPKALSKEQEQEAEEDVMRARPRKERIQQSLAKLKKGADGRFINVLEVASDLNLLIAAYQNLKAQERPTYLIEDSDDEDSMDGISLERFKKLQKRLRTGTYEFASAKKPQGGKPIPKEEEEEEEEEEAQPNLSR